MKLFWLRLVKTSITYYIFTYICKYVHVAPGNLTFPHSKDVITRKTCILQATDVTQKISSI
jgi:hypothetical protein